MRIGLVGPIGTEDVQHLLSNSLPKGLVGYPGAPFMATLIATFIEMGHEVVGFTCDSSLKPTQDPIVLEGARFRLFLCPARPNGTLPRNGRIGRIWDFFRLERMHLERAVRSVGLDVLHAHWQYEFAMVALSSGIPSLITAHDLPLEVFRLNPTPYTFGRLLMARNVLKRASHITTVSHYVARKIANWSRGEVKVVGNPLPKWLLEVRAKSSATLQEDKRVSIVMVPGYWSRLKNPMPGIRAFESIKLDVPQLGVELLLFGADFGPNGRAQSELENAGVSLSNIRFMGATTHRELIESMALADVLVHTSLTESFGMVVAEAMAVGVPVIAGSSTGAMPWLLDEGSCGQLIDVTNPIEIRDAVLRVARKEPAIEVMAARARTRIWEVAAPEKVANAYLENYRSVIK